jgi:small-conductance mechanosensitive channel
MDVFEQAWMQVQDAFALLPAPIVAVLMLAIAVTAALVAGRVAMVLGRRALGARHPLLLSVLTRMHGPLRLALLLLALNIAVPLAPLDFQLAGGLSRLLQVSFIALVGWMVLTSLNVAADLYIRRFDIAAADNLIARKQVTQVRVLKGALGTLIVVITVAAALMTFEQVRQYGVSLFASAGIAGIVVGLAARPMLSNLIAGVQLAITQPIRLEDAVLVENEMGFIEEINATYVVVRLWDWRRLVVPLTYFIEKPFQNWTREGAALIGAATIRTDYTVPVARVREEFERIVKSSPLWDRRVLNLQVTESDDRGIELRALVSADNSGRLWDLRCEVREKLIAFLQRDHPQALPRRRQDVVAHAPPLAPGDTQGERIAGRAR